MMMRLLQGKGRTGKFRMIFMM